jgi:hypothetical protein
MVRKLVGLVDRDCRGLTAAESVMVEEAELFDRAALGRRRDVKPKTSAAGG